MQQDTQETEVRETTTREGGTTVQRQAVTQRSQTSGIVIAQRVVWFIVGLINIIIALRFVFLLLGANQGVSFTDFIYSLSAPFVAPFIGIFGQPTYGQSVFEVCSLLAMVIYTLIGWGIVKLITISHPNQEI